MKDWSAVIGIQNGFEALSVFATIFHVLCLLFRYVGGVCFFLLHSDSWCDHVTILTRSMVLPSYWRNQSFQSAEGHKGRKMDGHWGGHGNVFRRFTHVSWTATMVIRAGHRAW